MFPLTFIRRLTRRCWALLAVATLTAPIANRAHAADFYFDAVNGNNSNTGDLGSPWQTVAKFNALDLEPGDNVYFAGGQTFSGAGLVLGPEDRGTAASPITITSYGTGRATIQPPATQEGLYADSAAGLRISQLNFTGAGKTIATKDGIDIFNLQSTGTTLSYLRIDNVSVSGFYNYGLFIGAYGGAADDGYDDVEITNSAFFNNAGTGVLTDGSFSRSFKNVYVGNVLAYGNSGAGGRENGIVLGDVDTGVIERSVAYSNGSATTGNGGVGIWTYDSTGITIQFCESYNNRTSGGSDGGGFDLDQNVSNSVMQYNYSHGNDGGGFLLSQGPDNAEFKNNIVRYNVSENDGRKNGYAGIEIYGRVTNTEIYNNTVFMTTGGAGSGSTGSKAFRAATFTGVGVASGVRVANNIFFVRQTGATASTLRLVLLDSRQATAAGVKFVGNNYWSENASGTATNFRVQWGATTYTSLTAWLDAQTTQERIDSTGDGMINNSDARLALNIDPKLTNAGGGVTFGDANLLGNLTAYRLRSTPVSPMINAGLNLPALFALNVGARDYFANTLPQGGSYDIGAHDLGAPFVTASASATPNPVLNGSAQLSATAADEAGEPALTYTWATTGSPPAPVTFSVNGTNAAKTTSATFSKAGMYSFAVTITNAAGLSASSTVDVTVNQTFEFWLTEHGLTGDDALPEADPYGIGIANLVAYALGIEPTASNASGGLPLVDIQDGLLRLRYEAPRTDVTYEPQWSATLTGWDPTGITVMPSGTSRTATIPVGTDARKFMRLHIWR